MNKKGQVLIYGLMLGLLLIILALNLAPTISFFTTTAMNATEGDTFGLDCANSSISDINKATCIVVDLNLFYWVGALIFLSGGIITAKIIFT